MIKEILDPETYILQVIKTIMYGFTQQSKKGYEDHTINIHVENVDILDFEINNETKDFEPIIVGFLCNWCSYAGADLAGTSRIQYPPNVRIIRVMCSGSVDSMYILRALLEGADGVFVGGCHPGDCHYIDGNYKARRRMVLLQNIFETLGIEKERVWIRWISASEGQKFADTMKDMTEAIRKLGPNPIAKKWNI
jgi:F420-non-reducing hydrogenase iron-sulfur subunit